MKCGVKCKGFIGFTFVLDRRSTSLSLKHESLGFHYFSCHVIGFEYLEFRISCVVHMHLLGASTEINSIVDG